jgi:hypothetical protein
MQFSLKLDDLFEDDSDKVKSPKESKESVASTRKYIDQNWKLNSDDSKEFKGVSKDAVVKSSNEAKEKLPMFALMYKFRKEYYDIGAESVMADHKGYAAKFIRLASTQFIKIAKARIPWTI